MPHLGSKFEPMSRLERQLITLLDKKGGLKGVSSVSEFLSLTISTSQDNWDFRSCLIECVARTSDDIKFELTKCGQYIDILKEWLEEMKTKSSHESLVYKILESLIELPIDHIKLEHLKKLGRIIQKGFSANRKNKKIEISSRVEDRCNKVLERLKRKIREIQERPADAPIPSRPMVTRPTTTSTNNEKKKENEQRKKRPRPVTSNMTSSSSQKRARTEEQQQQQQKEKEDGNVMEVNETTPHKISLPKITASGFLSSTPRSIEKKKRGKKKSVRFNLNLNTTHFVPYKEKSTLRRDQSSGDKLSRAEAQLLAKKKGMDEEPLIHGVSTETEWVTPSLLSGFKPTTVTDKTEIERMKERRVTMGEGRKYKISSREKPPTNPSPQDVRDRMKRMRFGKTVEIPVKEENLGSPKKYGNSSLGMPVPGIGGGSNMFLGMGFQRKSSEVCKYFNSSGGCQRGTACKFLHVVR